MGLARKTILACSNAPMIAIAAAKNRQFHYFSHISLRYPRPDECKRVLSGMHRALGGRRQRVSAEMPNA
jgi:hypothetical protein